jgi:iron donor protein CyaY
MNETEYHRLADALLAHLEQILEPADQSGLIELESGKDMLTIELEDGKQFIVSKHNASKQVWLSSPISGGLHFTYNTEKKDWCLADQRELSTILLAELKQLAGVSA